MILGIDPGIALMGYGVIQTDGMKHGALDYGTVETTAADSLPQRLMRLHQGTRQLLEHFRPDAVAVEELFFNQNAKTALTVGQARGVILLTCAQYTEALYEYTPLQVKQAVVGYGRAEKKQVQIMTQTLLCLQKLPRPDDAADALAVAICHAHSGKMHAQFKIK